MNRLFARLLAASSCLLPLLVACTSSTVINEAEPPDAADTAASETAPAEAPPAPPAPAEPAGDGKDSGKDPGKVTIDTSRPGGPDGAKSAKDGAACSTHGDCASGVCEGEGCGAGQGICAAKDRQCTMDLRQYCGCDGKTFQGGGNCPRNRFAKKGPCEGSAPAGPVLKRP